MDKFQESYGRIDADKREFDVEFWQSKGDEAIFQAALELINDSLVVKQEYAHEPRLQKSIESFGKI